jgi:hypothetical protein
MKEMKFRSFEYLFQPIVMFMVSLFSEISLKSNILENKLL